MEIALLSLTDGAARAKGLTVIIDVFRAVATACHVLERHPCEYLFVESSQAATRLLQAARDPILIGKPELGADLCYDIPNSPTRARGLHIAGRTVLHRTGAGAQGILVARQAEDVVIGSFVNADAIVRYIRLRRPAVVSLVAMGHEGSVACPADELCAAFLLALLENRPFDLVPQVNALRVTSGSYFFGAAQDEYPQEDFAHCLELSRFPFVPRAELLGDYARLTALNVPA